MNHAASSCLFSVLFFVLNGRILLHPRGCLQVITSSHVPGITYVFDSITEIMWFYALAANCSLWSLLREEMSPFVRGVSMKVKSCLLRICLLDFCILKLFHLFILGYQLPGLLCQGRRKLSQHHRATSGLSWRFSKRREVLIKSLLIFSLTFY